MQAVIRRIRPPRCATYGHASKARLLRPQERHACGAPSSSGAPDGDDLPRNPLLWPLTSLDPLSVRNFCIIAHVDHGKSSLASRLLESAYSSGDAAAREDVSALDALPVERRRGITVKSAAASLPSGRRLLNMVDTPGHADFHAEVGRALSFVDGCVLAVDCVRGVQAQTVRIYHRDADHCVCFLFYQKAYR
mmetsp:Transcript_20742/g.41492  ORF Transcript_20742/g.41492 Transcript_20742/m.41492 type:complete len:192 (+) Transcript_20742:99-674(+)